MHISAGGGAAEKLKEQQAAQLQASQSANSATDASSTGTDPFPSLLQASPALPAGQASSAAPASLSALLAAQEQNGANDLAGNLSALDKLLSGATGSTNAQASPSVNTTA